MYIRVQHVFDHLNYARDFSLYPSYYYAVDTSAESIGKSARTQ